MCSSIKIVWLGFDKLAKISPKMAKNSLFSTFFAFLKNCSYDSYENLYCHSTPFERPICAMASKSYGWDVRNNHNQPKSGHKTAIFLHFSNFPKTVYTIRKKFSTVILHHLRDQYVQWHQNRMAGM